MKRVACFCAFFVCVPCFSVVDDVCRTVEDHLSKKYVVPKELADDFIVYLRHNKEVVDSFFLPRDLYKTVSGLVSCMPRVCIQRFYPDFVRVLNFRSDMIQVLNDIIIEAEFVSEDKPEGAADSCEITIEQFNEIKEQVNNFVKSMPNKMAILPFLGVVTKGEQAWEERVPRDSEFYRHFEALQRCAKGCLNESLGKLFNYWLLFLFSDKKEDENYKQCETIVRQAGTKLKVYLGASKSMAKPRLAITHAEQILVDAPAKSKLELSLPVGQVSADAPAKPNLVSAEVQADAPAKPTLAMSSPVEQASVAPAKPINPFASYISGAVAQEIAKIAPNIGANAQEIAKIVPNIGANIGQNSSQAVQHTLPPTIYPGKPGTITPHIMPLIRQQSKQNAQKQSGVQVNLDAFGDPVVTLEEQNHYNQ